ncbi:MAG TPA: peptidylprolyl isomerase [Candidatus Glassbacteria bacterium]|nr:peptidylprolyl isomerase [Candidatus Glassbacteria bacterium]
MKIFASATFFLAVAVLTACSPPTPRTGMELARLRDIEEQRRERDVFVIETDLGRIVILPLEQAAPNTAREIKNLINRGFYDGLAFHYVEKSRLIQGGDVNSRDDDPANDGSGDPGFRLQPEISAPNLRGGVGIAHPPDETNQGNSQFYILLQDMPNLNGRYTIFGSVVEGLDVAEKISELEADENGHPKRRVEITKVIVERRFI